MRLRYGANERPKEKVTASCISHRKLSVLQPYLTSSHNLAFLLSPTRRTNLGLTLFEITTALN